MLAPIRVRALKGHGFLALLVQPILRLPCCRWRHEPPTHHTLAAAFAFGIALLVVHADACIRPHGAMAAEDVPVRAVRLDFLTGHLAQVNALATPPVNRRVRYGAPLPYRANLHDYPSKRRQWLHLPAGAMASRRTGCYQPCPPRRFWFWPFVVVTPRRTASLPLGRTDV